MTQYLTHPPTITPSGAVRPALIEQDLDELVLEENYEEEIYSGNLQAARARSIGRGAGVAEPFRELASKRFGACRWVRVSVSVS